MTDFECSVPKTAESTEKNLNTKASRRVCSAEGVSGKSPSAGLVFLRLGFLLDLQFFRMNIYKSHREESNLKEACFLSSTSSLNPAAAAA